MPDQHRDQVVQLTGAELDRYANQLARCLKALDTGAPIRAHDTYVMNFNIRLGRLGQVTVTELRYYWTAVCTLGRQR